MKIISRYVLREHAGPLLFAFTALTSLMLLNFISRQFGQLVGKGLPWGVIGQFFLLSIPFTVALTVPMSVLVAVLYAFSRLAAENEVNAFKASGVSPWRMVTPALGLGVVMTVGLLAFNDQVLPRANHQLKTLQEDIQQTKPTLALKDQVINTIAEGKFYLKAEKIDQAGGRMKKVVIYDLGDPVRRRTIYADSGRIQFASNRVDLDLDLYSGQMQLLATDKPTQLDRLFYRHDRIKVRNVGGDFKQTAADSSTKSDREMGICEMQRRLWSAETQYAMTKREADIASKPANEPSPPVVTVPPKVPEPHGIGWVYCTLLRNVPGVRNVEAAEVDSATMRAVREAQDTVPAPKRDTTGAKRDSSAVKHDTSAKKDSASRGAIAPVTSTVPQSPVPVPVNPAPVAGQPPVSVQSTPALPGQLPPGVQAPGAVPGANAPGTVYSQTQEQIAAQAAAEAMRAAATNTAVPAGNVAIAARTAEAKLRLSLAERARNRYKIEIHKKFSLAAACLIFCVLAPPLALRFPRGGVGLVIGVSLIVFALYYVGLIGGEALANKGTVPPFWAMWGTNVIMTAVGVVMMLRLGHDQNTGRGGGIREWLDNRRARRQIAREARTAQVAS